MKRNTADPFRCKYVEGGFAIAPRSFDICCRPKNLPEFAVAPFSSGSDTLPIEPLLERRQAMRDRFDAGTMPAHCRKCPHFERGEWKERAHVITQLNLKHHSLCQLRCVYCHRAMDNPGARMDRKNSPLSPLAAIRTLIGEGRLDPEARVGWGGGENTLLSDFEEIFSLLLEHGCHQGVSTNAVLYSPALGDALEEGRCSFTCSLDAGTTATYQAVKGGDFLEKVLDNLRRYHDRCDEKRRMRLKYVLRPENMRAAEIESFLGLCSSFPGVQVILDIDTASPAGLVAPAIEAAGAAMERLRDQDLFVLAGPNLRAAATHAGAGEELRRLPLRRPVRM